MLDITKAPDKGTIYAVSRKSILCKSYRKETLDKSILEDPGLLELHLFDKDTEYRCVKTRMHGYMQKVLRKNEMEKEYDDLYEESVFVLGTDPDKQEGLRKKVKVVNYIKYNEDDILTICNYRLEEEDENG